VNIFSIYWRVFGRATYKAGSTKVNICGSWWVQGKFGCPSTNVYGLDFVDWNLWKVVTQVGFHLLAKNESSVLKEKSTLWMLGNTGLGTYRKMLSLDIPKRVPKTKVSYILTL